MAKGLCTVASLREPLKTYSAIPHSDELREILAQKKWIFFDLDGTLANTERIHARGLKRLLEVEFKINDNFKVSQLLENYHGQSEPFIYHDLVMEKIIDQGLGFETFLHFRNQIAIEMLHRFEGAIMTKSILDFVHQLKLSGKKMAIVSSAERIFIDEFLSILDISNYFDFTIAREDTLENKPAAMPYLKALELGQCATHEAIVFEDSVVGRVSASTANIDYIWARWFE